MGRSLRVCFPVAAVVLALTAGRVDAQSAPAPVVSKWDGTVTADAGAMRIVVTLTQKGDAMTGQIESPHGIFTIKNGTLSKGVWQLPFEAEDGSKGVMKGKITDDDFTGDWDFSPRAVGTFALKRVKS
jgi:hypothetical protein